MPRGGERPRLRLAGREQQGTRGERMVRGTRAALSLLDRHARGLHDADRAVGPGSGERVHGIAAARVVVVAERRARAERLEERAVHRGPQPVARDVLRSRLRAVLPSAYRIPRRHLERNAGAREIDLEHVDRLREVPGSVVMHRIGDAGKRGALGRERGAGGEREAREGG